MQRNFDYRQQNDPCENYVTRALLNRNKQKSLRGYGWAFLIIPAAIYLGTILGEAILFNRTEGLVPGLVILLVAAVLVIIFRSLFRKAFPERYSGATVRIRGNEDHSRGNGDHSH